MARHYAVATALVTFVVAGVSAATVSLSLESSKDGKMVAPGATIEWTIRVSVSDSDNAGLALVCCDLVQDPTNPALFDLAPADVASIDSVMQNFSRPLGVSNPGENGADTGYIGVQRGGEGEKNLIQIGGAQNTFGGAGASIGTNANVTGGVGQDPAGQVVASGAFDAPAFAGDYGFDLKNVIANVLSAVSVPPIYSPVVAADIDTSDADLDVTVGLVGDVNCDGAVNAFDIDPFVVALVNPSQHASLYPQCDISMADINGDGAVNAFDIDPFVVVLVSGS